MNTRVARGSHGPPERAGGRVFPRSARRDVPRALSLVNRGLGVRVPSSALARCSASPRALMWRRSPSV